MHENDLFSQFRTIITQGVAAAVQKGRPAFREVVSAQALQAAFIQYEMQRLPSEQGSWRDMAEWVPGGMLPGQARSHPQTGSVPVR